MPSIGGRLKAAKCGGIVPTGSLRDDYDVEISIAPQHVHRGADRIVHPLLDLIKQRVCGLALGYEGLNDDDELRRDSMLAAALSKDDPKGEQRRRAQGRGKALAG